MNKSTITNKELEIMDVSVFGAGWVCLGIHAFWSVLYGALGYALHFFAGSKAPNILMLIAGSPLAWISGAATAMIFNVIAILFGGLKIHVSTREHNQPPEPSTHLHNTHKSGEVVRGNRR